MESNLRQAQSVNGKMTLTRIKTSNCRSDWWRSKCPLPSWKIKIAKCELDFVYNVKDILSVTLPKIRSAFCISEFQRYLLTQTWDAYITYILQCTILFIDFTKKYLEGIFVNKWKGRGECWKTFLGSHIYDTASPQRRGEAVSIDLGQLAFGQRSQLGKGGLVIDRQFSQHLAVNRYSSQLQAMHKGGIIHTVLLAAGIDASNPQLPEVTLFKPAAYIGVLQGLHHLLIGHFKMFALCAPIALG